MKIELAPGVIAIVNDGDRENEGRVVTLMFLCPPDSGFNVNLHSLVNFANYPVWVCEGDVSVVIEGMHGAKSNGWGAFKPEHLIPIGEGNPPTPQKVSKSKPGCVVFGAADDAHEAPGAGNGA
ncbi:hypothetical protein HP475_15300 [Serratia marcescens]|uniref:hypothetical protein n=1 Tax=Serratia marcescens TaxID=615 RepID=UPI0015D8C4B3|nr:hypothetical protein [Serratia marcescens]QLJ61199.1 hypothetical protein HP475_15300 [Serratia marcescens]